MFVTTSNTLKTEKVKVEFGIGVNTINRKNDKELFTNPSKYTILYNGKRQNEIINEYGENDFLITYDNKYYLSFRHFKFNRRHQHKYYFHFFENDNKIIVKVDIKGEDSMEFERPMIDKYNSENYRCNAVIDSAATMYNMIELKR